MAIWGFMHKQGGLLGVRNREQTLPVPKECWALREMPTPGSAPSKVIKSGSLAGSRCNSKDQTATVKRPTSSGSLSGSNAGHARANNSRESAATMATLVNNGEDSCLKDHTKTVSSGGQRGDRSSGERHVAFRTKSFYSESDHEFNKSRSSPTLSTPQGSLSLTDDLERKMPQLGVRVRSNTRSSGACGRQSTRRHRSQVCQGPPAAVVAAITVPGTPGGESHSSQMHTPARRLQGLGGGTDRQDGDRQRANSVNMISRTSSPARIAAMRPPPAVAQHFVSGAAAALDADARFQESLMVEWKRDFDCDSKPDVVQNKQLCQFFDFLMDSSKEGLLPGASRYIKEACGDIDSLEMEIRKGQPEFDPSEVLEFTSKQRDQLRTTLKCFAQASSPRARCNDVLYRPTFCRFLIDSGLVCMEDHTKNVTGYHKAVRLFDALAQSSTEGEKGKSVSFGAARCATVDQCVTVVGHLLDRQVVAQGPNGNSGVWNDFEYGLLEAQRTVQAIINEGKRRATAAVAKLGEIDLSDEAFSRQRKEVYGTHGSPPQFFSGSLREWSLGLKYWVDTSMNSCSEDFTSGHANNSFAAECYVRDMLLEPGCVHVCMKFDSLFKTLYEAYRDDTRERVSDESNSCVKRDTLPHMSFASFFRFCVDFGVYPHLCSFEEAWAAYCSSDCLVPVCGQESFALNNSRRAGRRASIHSSLEGGEQDAGEMMQSSGRSTPTSESEQEESNSEEEVMVRRVVTDSRVNLQRQPQPRQPLHPRVASKTLTLDSKEAPRAAGVHASEESVPSKDSHAISRRSKSVSTSPGEAKKIKEMAMNSEVSPVRSPTTDGLQVPAPTLGDRVGSKRRQARVAQQIVNDVTVQRDHERIGSLSRRDSFENNSCGSGSRRQSKLNAFELSVRSFSRRGLMDRPTSGQVEENLNTAAEAQSEGSQAADAKPRIKTSCDFAFVKKNFSTMSEKELDHYSVLSALNDCVTDRFHEIRGLVKASGQQTKQGLVDVDGFRGMLESMRITHPLVDDSQMEDFFSAVDPNASSTLDVDGRLMLDAAELEKAVNYVRQDLKKRGLLSKSSLPGNPAGGREPLGQAARHLSNNVVRFGDPTSGELQAAFGHASFTESLVLLGIQHMHSDGKVIKGSAPGGVKSLWLISFLHRRFDELIKEQHTKRTTAELDVCKIYTRAPESLSRTVSKDLPVKREIHDVPRPLDPLSEASTRPPTRDRENSRPSTRDAARDAPFSRSAGWVGGVEPPGLVSGEKDRKDSLGSMQRRHGFSITKSSTINFTEQRLLEKSEKDKEMEKEMEKEKEKEKEKAQEKPPFQFPCNIPPKRANYTSFLTILLDDHPDLFMRALSTAHMTVPVLPGRTAGQADGELDRRAAVLERPRFGFEPAPAQSICEACGKGLDEMGLGTVFCHQCSGVDSTPVKDSILYPVFERRRFRWELRELNNWVDPASSQQSGDWAVVSGEAGEGSTGESLAANTVSSRKGGSKKVAIA